MSVCLSISVQNVTHYLTLTLVGETILTFSAEYHWFCHMDQPICGHLDHHSPVASCHHVHAPEDDTEHAQDHPKVCHVPGKAHLHF